MDLGFLGTFFWDFYPLARSAQSPVRWFGQSGRSQGSGRDRIPDFCSSPTEFVIIWGLTIKMIVDESWYWIFSPAWFLCRSLRTSIGFPINQYKGMREPWTQFLPVATAVFGLNHLKGKWWYMSVVKRGNGKSPINGSFNGTVRNLFVNMTDFKVPRIITPEGKHFNKPDDQHLDQPLVSGQGQSCLEPCSKRGANLPLNWFIKPSNSWMRLPQTQTCWSKPTSEWRHIFFVGRCYPLVNYIA